MVREVKERKSKEEGVDADDVDLVDGFHGTRLDDDGQWWQTNNVVLYMFKR